MSHTVSGQTTNYTWDPSAAAGAALRTGAAASLPVVLQDNTYTYVYGLSLISATDSGGNQNYYMHNGQGSVANIIDYNGNEKARYLYDAFGNTRYTLELTPNVWKYTGEQQDDGTGFYYLRARYYDPFLGRFITRDPVGEGNGYSYAFNNPVNLADPSGLSVKSWLEDNLGIDMDVAEFAGKMILSSSPVIGDINDAICAVTGYDIIWGESVGTGGQALCALGALSPWASGGILRQTDEVSGVARAVRGGENASAAYGRRMHQELKEKILAKGGGWSYAPPSGGLDGKLYRPDVVTPTGHILELKPDTVSGRLASGGASESHI